MLPLFVLLPLLLGVGACLLAARRSLLATSLAAGLTTALTLGLLLTLMPQVIGGETIIQRWRWIPEIGLDLSFRLDGLGLLFALLILGIGLLVVLYARYYLSESDDHGRFFALLMAFMAAMLGIVLAENLLLLVVFWELTSLTSFLLIGFKSESAESRQGARMALAVTGGGGLALLGGVLLLGDAAGSFELTQVLAAGDRVRAHPHYLAALLLILLGAFTKSAQFPFHFWLPSAMAAPTPVSAYLHSATMVKAGVFLLARLYPVLGGSVTFEYVVAGVGLTTLVTAAYIAVFRHDLKGLLAYSTISHLGLITFLLGLDTPLSAVAAVFHIINHATFKASLFMAAGIIDHETGSRDMQRLNGLWHFMPHTATLAMVAAAAMAGVPLFNGFLSKEMFFAEALEIRDVPVLGAIAPIAVTLGGAFSVAYSLRFVHDVFFNGEPRDLPKTPHEPPRYMKVPVEILVVIVIAVGILPAYTVAPLLNVAARDVLGGTLPEYSIALWHGWTAPLAMSALAIGGGALMYWLLQHKYNLHLHVPAGLTGRVLFTRAYDGSVAAAAAVTRAFDNGSLPRALALMALTLVCIGGGTLMVNGFSPGAAAGGEAPPLALVIAGLAMVAAIATVYFHQQRLAAVVLAGVVGLAAALTFAWFSAPDLALTQLAVEVVTTVLLLMALGLLPQEAPPQASKFRLARDVLISIAAGGGVAALAWAALTRPHETISWYFLERSVPGGGGSNVVNVILVDFRGFDTFGEITVLGIAAVGAAMLMQNARMQRAQPSLPPANFLMLSAAARLLLPFALMIAIYIFLRGHNQPGGGFVAGLIAAIALVTQYMGTGLEATLRRLRLDFVRLVGAGIAIAGATGAASLFFDVPFLTSAHGHPHVPLLGDLPLASAMAFDLGVFLTVLGAAMLAITALGRAEVDPTAPESSTPPQAGRSLQWR